MMMMMLRVENQIVVLCRERRTCDFRGFVWGSLPTSRGAVSRRLMRGTLGVLDDFALREADVAVAAGTIRLVLSVEGTLALRLIGVMIIGIIIALVVVETTRRTIIIVILGICYSVFGVDEQIIAECLLEACGELVTVEDDVRILGCAAFVGEFDQLEMLDVEHLGESRRNRCRVIHVEGAEHVQDGGDGYDQRIRTCVVAQWCG